MKWAVFSFPIILFLPVQVDLSLGISEGVTLLSVALLGEISDFIVWDSLYGAVGCGSVNYSLCHSMRQPCAIL